MFETLRKLQSRFFPKESFLERVGVLVGGTAVAQLLLILAVPILTRLYTPDAFGILAVFAGLLTIASVMSSLRYELAIPLPENDTEAANLVVLSLILVAINTSIIATLVALFNESIFSHLDINFFADYLWLVPVGTFLIGIYRVLNYWSTRTKNFRVIAGTKVSQAVATLMIQFGLYTFGSLGLIFGQIAGQSTGIISLGRSAFIASVFKDVTWLGIRKAAVKYRQFPLLSTPGGLINTASTKLPVMILFATFGPAVAGMLSVAEKALQRPASLIGTAISQVFFADAPKALRDKELKNLVETLSAKMIHIGVPPVLILFLYSPDLFSFVFGEPWRQAGEIASWIVFWVVLQFTSSPLSMVFAVTEKMGQSLTWQIMLFVINIIAVGYGVIFADPMTTIILLSVLNTLCYLTLIIWIFNVCGSSLIVLVHCFSAALGVALICASPLFITTKLFDTSQNVQIVAFMVSCMLLMARYLQIWLKNL